MDVPEAWPISNLPYDGCPLSQVSQHTRRRLPGNGLVVGALSEIRQNLSSR